jgi:hypothetical protein
MLKRISTLLVVFVMLFGLSVHAYAISLKVVNSSSSPSDSSIINSYTLPFFDPDRLTWNGSYLLASAGVDTDKKIYQVKPTDGSCSVLFNSLPGTGDTDGGLVWKGSHLGHGRDLISQIYITTGLAVNSFGTPSETVELGGTTWDGKCLIVSNTSMDKTKYLNPAGGLVVYLFDTTWPSPPLPPPRPSYAWKRPGRVGIGKEGGKMKKVKLSITITGR